MKKTLRERDFNALINIRLRVEGKCLLDSIDSCLPSHCRRWQRDRRGSFDGTSQGRRSTTGESMPLSCAALTAHDVRRGVAVVGFCATRSPCRQGAATLCNDASLGI